MTPYAFFYANAGWSYDPKTETKHQGRSRGARQLAKAEAKARDKLWSYQWEIDPDVDSSEFSDKRPRWKLWRCWLINNHGQKVKSLHGVDFGRGGEPWGDPYARVVQAELALEYMNEINS